MQAPVSYSVCRRSGLRGRACRLAIFRTIFRACAARWQPPRPSSARRRTSTRMLRSGREPAGGFAPARNVCGARTLAPGIIPSRRARHGYRRLGNRGLRPSTNGRRERAPIDHDDQSTLVGSAIRARTCFASAGGIRARVKPRPAPYPTGRRPGGTPRPFSARAATSWPLVFPAWASEARPSAGGEQEKRRNIRRASPASRFRR